jgi:hypothetical protein
MSAKINRDEFTASTDRTPAQRVRVIQREISYLSAQLPETDESLDALDLLVDGCARLEHLTGAERTEED